MNTKRISSALFIAAIMLVAAAALRYGRGHAFISTEAAQRAIQVIVGLVLAVYGNYLPKEVGGTRASTRRASRLQPVLRFGGWSLTLAGLIDAGLWAFASAAFAQVTSLVIVAGATLATAGYAAWTAVQCSRRASTYR